MSELKKHI